MNSKMVSKMLPTLFKQLNNVPKNISVMNNTYRNILESYNGNDFINLSNKIPICDNNINIKEEDNYRVMLGILESKQITYHHLNRHLKVLDGDINVSFNVDKHKEDYTTFLFNNENALTIASPHYLINNSNKKSIYMWIEETPKFQNTYTI